MIENLQYYPLRTLDDILATGRVAWGLVDELIRGGNE